jgi:hypothetical protein
VISKNKVKNLLGEVGKGELEGEAGHVGRILMKRKD